MMMCECPVCSIKVDLYGCEENEIIECPACGTNLEIVSLSPPVLEDSSEDDDDWNNDFDDMD
jgi:alpha-aminoadipate carrier protein LysW